MLGDVYLNLQIFSLAGERHILLGVSHLSFYFKQYEYYWILEFVGHVKNVARDNCKQIFINNNIGTYPSLYLYFGLDTVC